MRHPGYACSRPLTLLGGVGFALRTHASHNFVATIVATSPWLGDAILWLAGAHALAALYHHFVLKDKVLIRCFRQPS